MGTDGVGQPAYLPFGSGSTGDGVAENSPRSLWGRGRRPRPPPAMPDRLVQPSPRTAGERDELLAEISPAPKRLKPPTPTPTPLERRRNAVALLPSPPSPPRLHAAAGVSNAESESSDEEAFMEPIGMTAVCELGARRDEEAGAA